MNHIVGDLGDYQTPRLGRIEARTHPFVVQHLDPRKERSRAMSDYAVTPVQPIVQGLVTIPSGTPGGPVIFTGKGALPTVTRDPASGSGQGAFILTLDQGLPGNAGALQPLPDQPGATFPAVPDARTLVTVRGDPNIAPPVTTITQIAVAYITSPTPGVGVTQIEIVLTIAGVGTDPVGTNGNGFEVVVWKGVESP